MISIFTPSHHPRWLDHACRSILTQGYRDWEWVVLLNGEADWTPPVADDRIKVHHSANLGSVGALKAEACALATGDILLELDHDDLLATDALTRIADAFEQTPAPVCVYSDFATVDVDGKPTVSEYDPAMGWTYYDTDGHHVCRAMEPTPHNLAYIWYAPNHVRAFAADAYDEVGGYNPDQKILDDQDLMARLYRIGEFTHLTGPLYLQRNHDTNTQIDSDTNAAIQVGTVEMYWATVTDLALAWARRRRLAILDVSPTWLSEHVGTMLDPGDLAAVDTDSVGLIVANETLQRIDRDTIGGWLAEAWRVLAPGGLMLTTTPSTDGRGAFQDPTHVSWWNQNSFWYLTQTWLRDQTYPGVAMRWQTSGIRTRWLEDSISYVDANLIAIKNHEPRQGGPLL